MSAFLDELRRRLPADCLQTDVDVTAAYSQDRALFETAGTAAVLGDAPHHRRRRRRGRGGRNRSGWRSCPGVPAPG